jgi:hypothetical protein
MRQKAWKRHEKKKEINLPKMRKTTTITDGKQHGGDMRDLNYEYRGWWMMIVEFDDGRKTWHCSCVMNERERRKGGRGGERKWSV